MSFNGKVAVIAGATGGLGKAVAQQMAHKGARLVLIGRNKDRLKELLDELELPAEEHMLSTGDLSQPGTLGETAQAAMEKFGQIDILLNLIGGWKGGETITDMPAEAVQDMLDQHLWTTYHLTQAFVPYLRQSSAGRVIVVSSPTASQPGVKTGPYAIGKAAQETLILTLSEELAGSEATANILQVKAIDTKGRRDTDTSGKYASWTTPEEIVAAILYLGSSQARMINGTRIPLYG